MKKELQIEDIVIPLPFKTHQVNLFWSMSAILKDGMNIDYDVYLPTKGMNLQRPLCWNLEQKQQLILSIIKGVYVPKLAILIDSNTKDYKYQIIDGKQRLSAIISFLKDEFCINVRGEDYLFSEMATPLKNKVRGYSLVCEVAYFYDADPIDDAGKIAWFEQINFTGTPQDAEHLTKLKQQP